jgi:activator of HSP90 ATPase
MISARFGISSICFPLVRPDGSPNTSIHDFRLSAASGHQPDARAVAGRKEHWAMAWDFTVSDVIPAAPGEIYAAWLSSDGHEKITGGALADISAVLGTDFTAWDGYITGRNLTLEPGRRIVQSWRTSQFTAADQDSQIEVLLEACPGGTRVTLHHTNVPDGHTSYRDGGWQDNYFEPMKAHFSRSG